MESFLSSHDLNLRFTYTRLISIKDFFYIITNPNNNIFFNKRFIIIDFLIEEYLRNDDYRLEYIINEIINNSEIFNEYPFVEIFNNIEKKVSRRFYNRAGNIKELENLIKLKNLIEEYSSFLDEKKFERTLIEIIRIQEYFNRKGDLYNNFAMNKSISFDESIRLGDDSGETNKFKNRKKQLEYEKINTHFSVTFPHYCQLKEEIKLKLKISKHKQDAIYNEVIKLLKETNSANLSIILTANSFALQKNEYLKNVEYFFDKDIELEFQLFPVELGTQNLELEIYQTNNEKSYRIGYFLIHTTVYEEVWYRSTHVPAKISMIENSINNFENTLIENFTLNVNFIERENKLQYSILGNEQEIFYVNTPNLKSEIEEYLKELNVFLTEIVVRANPIDSDWESMNISLSGYGTALANNLLPSEIINFINKIPEFSTLIISTNESWIPWELFHSDGKFWGEKLILSRYPRTNNNLESFSLKEKIGKKENKLSIKKILNIIGGGIIETDMAKLGGLFNRQTSCQIDTLHQKTISELKSSIFNSNLIHFTCHGFLNPHMLQISGDKTQFKNLLTNSVSQLSICEKSFIFANACSSDVAVITFGKFTSFGWEFYINGADVFIGTLGQVPINYALPFAESVYNFLFEDNNTVGVAILKAKQEAKKNRNLFWLLYTIYGNPDTNVSLKLNQ